MEEQNTDLPQPDVVTRVIDWNSARYPQVLDQTLAFSLLTEEQDEGIRATDEIDIMDSYGDRLFVAIGVLWKSRALDSSVSIDYILSLLEGELSIPKYLKYLTEDTYPHKISEHFARLELFSVCNALLGEDFTPADLLAVICTSNETKAVERANPNEKANTNKGDDFVPPTEGIKNLLKGKQTFAEL